MGHLLSEVLGISKLCLHISLLLLPLVDEAKLSVDLRLELCLSDLFLIYLYFGPPSFGRLLH